MKILLDVNQHHVCHVTLWISFKKSLFSNIVSIFAFYFFLIISYFHLNLIEKKV